MRDKFLLKIVAVLIALLMLVSCAMTLIVTVSALDITDQFLEEHYGYVVNPPRVLIDIVDGDNDSVLLGHRIIFNGSSEVEIRGIEGTPTEGKLAQAVGTTDLTGDGVVDTEFNTQMLAMEGLYNVSDGTNTETLTVSYPVMNLDLKIGNYSTTSIPRGTPLRIVFDTNLDAEDCVKLKLKAPDGYMKTWGAFNITQLLEYGSFDKSKQIDTSDWWKIGSYTIYVKTKEDNARGLNMKSNEKSLTITKGEIEIDASKTNPTVNETIVLTVRGVPYHNISLESSYSSKTVFEGGKYDYHGPDTAGPINGVMDEDGVKYYAVRFTNTGTYRINVEDLDEEWDDDINIMVDESANKTWYVPDNFSTIQAAINAASAGNTIIVRDGTYTENVKINKPNLTIISENGSAKTIINASEPRNPVLEITSNYINISGFTIKGATEGGGSGIHLCANHCDISNNIVSNNDQGIYFDESTNNTLENNIFSNNSWTSIMLSDSSNNRLKKNDISNNSYGSLYCSGYSKTDFDNVIDTTNTINKNPVYYYFDQKDRIIENLNTSWMGFAYCSNFTIRNNSIHHGEGISFVFCNDSRIIKNKISNNTGNVFYKSKSNVISKNEIHSNIKGLLLLFSDNNGIINNSVNTNEYGISLHYSKNNDLKKNTMSNQHKNLEIRGSSKIYYNNTIDDTNTIKGLPIYYYYDEHDLTIKDKKTHYMGIAGCDNVTIRNADIGDLQISFSNQSTILANNISKGMPIYVSDNTTAIQNNIIGDVEISLSDNNILEDNVMNSSRVYPSSSSVLIANNLIRGGGISCSYHSPSDLIIENNTILDCDYGIERSPHPVRRRGGGGLYLYIDIPSPPSNPVTQKVIIKGNEILKNTYGIRLIWMAHNVTIANNDILDNDWGVYLEDVHSCTIMNNTISNNENGIRLQWCCYDNLIYNNYFDNTNNAYDDGYNNIWNITKTSGKNIVGGAYLGGNYWSDYIGNDTDGDGLGDTPYDIPGSLNRDYVPLFLKNETDNNVTLQVFRIKLCQFVDDSIPYRTGNSTIAYQVRIENDVDTSNESISNVTLKVEAYNITWTSHSDRLTLKTNTTAIWNFPCVYPELDYWADKGFQRVFFGTTREERVNAEVQVNRTCNQTYFDTKGTQHAKFNITFYNKSVSWFEGAIEVKPDETVGLKLLNFNTTLPLNWETTKPTRIDFELNKTLLQLNVPYSVEVDVEVNPSVPLCYKPMFYLGKGLNCTKKEDYLFVNTVNYSMVPPLDYLRARIDEKANWNTYEHDFVSFLLEEQKDLFVFDTRQGGYPSISGTHNGTITPFNDINVSKLYTYPCAGTGGHTEYVRIWNSTDWSVISTWDGYKGDCHNISFDAPFTLVAGETYNYTIRTGSYPQIIHEQNYTTLDGSFINCTQFTDANGRKHTNWIPAIRLH